MSIFNIGLIIILILTALFFAVFFALCFRWADGHTNRDRAEIATMVTFIYGFIVFCVGAALAGVIALLSKLFS